MLNRIINIETHHPYPVILGYSLSEELLKIVGKYAPRRVVIFYQIGREDLLKSLEKNLSKLVTKISSLAIPAGEAGKELTVASRCWNTLGELGVDRNDLIISLGGGSTTDLAGFVASTWMRGLRVIHLPTTLLAITDAAIGGKTAINTAAGKNLVGTIHEPIAVLADLTNLDTLPPEQLRSGMAEIVKCGFIADPHILDLLEETPVVDYSKLKPDWLFQLVAAAIQVKADIVSKDLQEKKLRAVLNYGHTLGHAIEKLEQYHWSHGDAIAVGMIFAAQLSKILGKIDIQLLEKHYQLLAKLGLPTTYKPAVFTQLLNYMKLDKKNISGNFRLVILTGLAQPLVQEVSDTDWLNRAYTNLIDHEKEVEYT